ncbi:hypothetical protein BKA80DRAFT_279178 [Phyllosticta citrichinensis]
MRNEQYHFYLTHPTHSLIPVPLIECIPLPPPFQTRSPPSHPTIQPTLPHHTKQPHKTTKNTAAKSEQRPGIEPGTSGWDAVSQTLQSYTLPLSYHCLVEKGPNCNVYDSVSVWFLWVGAGEGEGRGTLWVVGCGMVAAGGVEGEG